jgi:hypothetical protein
MTACACCATACGLSRILFAAIQLLGGNGYIYKNAPAGCCATPSFTKGSVQRYAWKLA